MFLFFCVKSNKRNYKYALEAYHSLAMTSESPLLTQKSVPIQNNKSVAILKLISFILNEMGN